MRNYRAGASLSLSSFGRRGFVALLAALAVSACSSPHQKRDAVTVFAAASLTDALGEIATSYERETKTPVRLSFAASGSLARQIEAGAPAQIVILADRPWMDQLASKGRIDPATRVDLLGNRLVVIGNTKTRISGDPLAWLAAHGNRMAIGDPASVPAGAYASEWLQRRGQWDALKPKIVTALDVRAVRTFVARGEADLGIVYRSDVIGADGVRTVLEPPAKEQPHIVYPAAVIKDAGAPAAAFLHHLQSEKAAEVFRRHGFEAIAQVGPGGGKPH